MTNEQIKQYAKDCVEEVIRSVGVLWFSVLPKESADKLRDLMEYCIEKGAHSRDNEVKKLSERVEELQEYARTLQHVIDRDYNPWISVEDRLPEDDRDCLFTGDHIPVCFGSYYPDSLSGAVWSCDDGYWTQAKEVTHWMPIPELPKKGE